MNGAIGLVQDRGAIFGALSSLLQACLAPAWLFDAHWLNILAVNGAAIERYGYSEVEFLRLTMADLLSDANVGEFVRSLEPGRLTERSRRWEHRGRDGARFTVQIRLDRVDYRGQSICLALLEDAEGKAISVNSDEALFRARPIPGGPSPRSGSPSPPDLTRRSMIRRGFSRSSAARGVADPRSYP